MSSARRPWPLRAFLVSEAVSITGTRMSMLAVPWFVLTTTGSPALTGAVAFAESLPLVVVMGLGGPIVDRFGARRVTVVAGLVAAVLLSAVPGLNALSRLSIGVLMVLVALIGAVRGMSSSTTVLLPGLAVQAGMPIERATGLRDGVNRAAGMVGVPLAGVLIAVWSAPVVLLLDAASFLIAATLVGLFVPKSAEPPRSTREVPGAPIVRTYVADLREGFSHLRRDRLLVAISMMVLVTNLLDQAYSSVFVPVWAHNIQGSPLAVGAIGLAFGLGAVAGSTLFAWIGTRLPRRRTFAWGFLIGGAPRFIVLAFAVVLPPVVATALIAGVAVGSINPALSATEYQRVPAALQARVLGALGALAMIGVPLGGLLGGYAVAGRGLTQALLAFGAVYLLTTLAPFAFPVWRQMDPATDLRDELPKRATPQARDLPRTNTEMTMPSRRGPH